jgi:hypothetical protein
LIGQRSRPVRANPSVQVRANCAESSACEAAASAAAAGLCAHVAATEPSPMLPLRKGASVASTCNSCRAAGSSGKSCGSCGLAKLEGDHTTHGDGGDDGRPTPHAPHGLSKLLWTCMSLISVSCLAPLVGTSNESMCTQSLESSFLSCERAHRVLRTAARRRCAAAPPRLAAPHVQTHARSAPHAAPTSPSVMQLEAEAMSFMGSDLPRCFFHGSYEYDHGIV